MKLLSILGKDATKVEILPSKFSVLRSNITGGTEGLLIAEKASTPIAVRVHCIKMSSCKSYPWEIFHSGTSEIVLSQTFKQKFFLCFSITAQATPLIGACKCL